MPGPRTSAQLPDARTSTASRPCSSKRKLFSALPAGHRERERSEPRGTSAAEVAAGGGRLACGEGKSACQTATTAIDSTMNSTTRRLSTAHWILIGRVGTARLEVGQVGSPLGETDTTLRPEELAPSRVAGRSREIDTPGMEGVTAQHPPGPKSAAAPEAVLEQGQPRILGAGRGKAAGAGQERRDPPLVGAEQSHRKAQ